MKRYLPVLILAIAVAAAIKRSRRAAKSQSLRPAMPRRIAAACRRSTRSPANSSGSWCFASRYQADLLAGIEKIVKEQKIKNAVILSGIGSVRDYQVHSVSNREFPSKNTFVKDPSTPADIVSVNGYVVNGEVHAHMTMTDPDKAFGGHIEPDTHVFTFAAITLGGIRRQRRT